MEPQSNAMIVAGKVSQTSMPPVDKFSGLASDSREVQAGYLFAALSGSKADGASYLKDAVARGAAAVLGRPELAAQVAVLGVTFIPAENPRRMLAQCAAAFYVDQPCIVAAVTGTNGKTSVAVFLREIWTALGRRAASMGTIGLVAPHGTRELHHTTPGPIELHRLLAQLKHEDVERLALEASSHGLDQFRLDGTRIAAVGFTNITRDHMDYHPTFEAYLACKLRLFGELAGENAVAVVNADAEHAGHFIAAAKARRLRLFTVGRAGETLSLLSQSMHAEGQTLEVAYNGRSSKIVLPLAGGFQALNALVAAGFALGLGEPGERVLESLRTLRGAPGRLEKVASTKTGAPVYVDYAHTPDAVATVLKALRPHTAGKLSIVFGCGGDRDKGKRPLMGQAAARCADRIIVTDDNPRSEDAAAIRKEVMAGCPGAREIGDRAEAIAAAIAELGKGDGLVIAGKGHETGQIFGDTVRPFSDRDEAIRAATRLGGAGR